MAHLAVQGGTFKQLFNGERVLFGCETKDPYQYCKAGHGLRFMDSHPLHFHKKRIKSYGSRRIFSSPRKRSSSSNAEERVEVDDGESGVKLFDEFGEIESDELACFRGLVLDISYRPVNVICWKRAICLEFAEKADVLEYYDQTVNSPGGSYYIPAVLRVPHLLQVVKRRRVKHYLSRKNILFRDGFTCQYCSSRENLTIDHILPIARGGEWKWENLVTACERCNSKKGSKTLEEANMKLFKVPKAPKDFDILAIPLTTAAINMLRRRKTMPDEWRQYLANPEP